MSSATQIIKPLSMADCCLPSLSTKFTPQASNYPSLSFPSKPIKVLQLCSTSSSSFSSFPSWVSLKNKNSSSPVVTLVASTNWASQEEGKKVVLDEFGVECPGDEFMEVRNERSFFEPPGEPKLFVENLPYDMDSEKLAELFNQAGIVEVSEVSEVSEVVYNRETDQSRGFAFVIMSSSEEAEKAMEMFNRYDINGRLLKVNKAAPRGSRAERPPREFEPSFRVYVGNLPWQADDARLEQVFSGHGKVVNARVVYDLDTGRSRGYGFVTMSSQTKVDDAIAALDGQTMDGREIRVNVAEQRTRPGSF